MYIYNLCINTADSCVDCFNIIHDNKMGLSIVFNCVLGFILVAIYFTVSSQYGGNEPMIDIDVLSRYAEGRLIELNAHSLFSKYFSESGKLVSKLFFRLNEIIEESNCLVFILIDEVESLTAARHVSSITVLAG